MRTAGALGNRRTPCMAISWNRWFETRPYAIRAADAELPEIIRAFDMFSGRRIAQSHAAPDRLLHLLTVA